MYKYILEGYCHESDPIKKINGSGSGNPLIILIYIFKIFDLLFLYILYTYMNILEGYWSQIRPNWKEEPDPVTLEGRM